MAQTRKEQGKKRGKMRTTGGSPDRQLPGACRRRLTPEDRTVTENKTRREAGGQQIRKMELRPEEKPGAKAERRQDRAWDQSHQNSGVFSLSHEYSSLSHELSLLRRKTQR